MRPHRLLTLALPAVLAGVHPATADQLPSRARPFDAAAVEQQGVVQEGAADRTTGELKGAVSVKASGYVSSMAGIVRPYVRWNYALGGTQPILAAVAVKYDLTIGNLDTLAGDPTCGSGYADVRVGVRVTDTASDEDVVRYVIESRGTAQAVVPMNLSTDHRGQEVNVTFKPGHSYAIDVYLQVQAGVYGGDSLGVQGTPGGTAQASATLSVESIKLVTHAKPWIRTTITDLYSPVHDTYDTYEQLLQRQDPNRSYGTVAAWIEVAAGGRYDAARSSVTIDGAPAPYRKLSATALPATPSATAVRLALPACDTLPLEGRTWRFLAYFDPEFQTPRDELGIGPPMFVPVFETLFAAGGRELAAGRSEQAGLRLVAVRTEPVVSPRSFYDLDNWLVVLPAAWFAPRAGAPAVAGRPTTLKVKLYVPAGQPAPKLAQPGLQVQRVSTLNLHGSRPEFTTEPVVLVSVQELWQQLCRVQLPNGLQLCANPPFIQLVQRLAEDAEAWRRYLDSLYLRAPNGELYKLTDLDEDRPGLSLATPGGTTPIWLPRRVRLWLRRAAALRSAALLLEESRPTQEHALRISGHVQNAAGQVDDSQHQRAYHVVLDVVPRPQPWPLPEMGASLP